MAKAEVDVIEALQAVARAHERMLLGDAVEKSVDACRHRRAIGRIGPVAAGREALRARDVIGVVGDARARRGERCGDGRLDRVAVRAR